MLRVRVTWTGPSSPLLSTHYFTPDIENAASATACHVAVATFWNTVRAVIADDFVYTVQPAIAQMGTDGQITGELIASNVASAVGQDAGDPLPFQTQGEVALLTSAFSAGRRLQGRLFIPGPTETSNTQGAPTSAYISTVNGALQTYVADATNVDPEVWSRAHSVSAGVTSGIVRSGWRVLRSRR